MSHTPQISTSIQKLEANLSQTSRVEEWAELMGFNCPKKFARMFMRHYSVRPIKVLYIRLKSITEYLREGKNSNFEIAHRLKTYVHCCVGKWLNRYFKSINTNKQHIVRIL